MGCLHQHTVIVLYRSDRNEKLLEILRILITTVHFTDQNAEFIKTVPTFYKQFSWASFSPSSHIIIVLLFTQLIYSGPWFIYSCFVKHLYYVPLNRIIFHSILEGTLLMETAFCSGPSCNDFYLTSVNKLWYQRYQRNF